MDVRAAAISYAEKAMLAIEEEEADDNINNYDLFVPSSAFAKEKIGRFD